MKLKMLSVMSAGMFFVIGGGLTGCKSTVQKFDTADSPINMGGGSIYGITKSGWQPITGQPYQYTAQSNNSDIDKIFTDGIVFATSLPASLSGWKIELSNKDHNNSRKPAAVTICSNPSCDFTSLGDHKTVYVTIRGDSRATLTSNNHEIRFHDKDKQCDGDQGEQEDTQCDFLVDVTFTSQSITTANHTQTGACNRGGYASGHCDIGIGAPLL